MSTASHITSDAIAPIDELFTDRRPTEGLGAGMATSSVVATNNVSPSIELWKGWIPRLIKLCTCRQSCLNSMSLSCRLVISTEIVVFPACTWRIHMTKCEEVNGRMASQAGLWIDVSTDHSTGPVYDDAHRIGHGDGEKLHAVDLFESCAFTGDSALD